MMSLFQKLLEFIRTIKSRAVDNKNTTIGGGVWGIVFAALVGKLEELSGCKFTTAFANVDYIQIAVFLYGQIIGALSTDANKTVVVTTKT